MLARLSALALAALTVSAVIAFAAEPPPATFQAGEQAYVALHFDEARRIYRRAGQSPALPATDRALALRQLGVMAWMLDRDAAEAERRFAQALGVGAEIGGTQAERARFLTAMKRFDEARAAADAAIAAAVKPDDKKQAALALAQAALASLKDKAVADQSAADVAFLTHARDALRPFSAVPPMPLDLSEALLEVALRLDDGPLALEAWQSYAREGLTSGTWAPAAQVLASALPKWSKSGTSPTTRDRVFEGFRISHFYKLAALVATDTRTPDAAAFAATARAMETVAYARFLDRVETITNDYYRRLAHGMGDSKAWQAGLIAAGKDLWPYLPFLGTRPQFSDDAFVAELGTRFGALVNIGQTGDVTDLHYGHVFIDDPRALDQYGRKASIRRVAIDRIVSNGYETWVWDGRQGHGGWADDKRVVQVRPGYADAALRVWDRITDPAQRDELERKIAAMTAADDAIMANDPAPFLPGLTLRLEFQGEMKIIDALKAKGASGPDLKRAFLVEQGRIKLESNFFAHEGRHVLDHQAFGDKLEAEELEFRAKLSEIAFSEAPRINFGSIFNPNIADATSPHGRANKRIVQGIVAWMTAHKAEIKGLDAARPLFPQFDKLSDDQMRTIMRGLDPWAPKT